MTIHMTDQPVSQTIDLTGLPAAVVREVQHLVQEAREQQARANGQGCTPQFLSRPQLTPAEFEQNLRELAALATGRLLPADFSRADIYDDHD